MTNRQPKPTRRNPLILLSTGALALALTACSGGEAGGSPATEPSATSTPQARGTTIDVSQFRFEPLQLLVRPGTDVTWTNRDAILHTATAGIPGAPTGAFDGQMADAGTSFSFRFEQPGRYPFFCSRHEFMRGEIEVGG